jgi:hypothetical protein
MLQLHQMASRYSWTYHEAAETPAEVIDALTTIRASEVRIAQRAQRLSNLQQAAADMQPQPRPRITAGRM